MDKDMVKVVFFVGLRRSRARVGTGGVESNDRGNTRELVPPSLGSPESWIGVVQFIQSQPQEVGLSGSDTIVYDTHDFTHTTDIREVRRLRGSAGALSGEDQGEPAPAPPEYTCAQAAPSTRPEADKEAARRNLLVGHSEN